MHSADDLDLPDRKMGLLEKFWPDFVTDTTNNLYRSQFQSGGIQFRSLRYEPITLMMTAPNYTANKQTAIPLSKFTQYIK